MTKEQKQRIERLRATGAGYKKIAKTLALPVSTVKSFCQRNAVPCPAKAIKLTNQATSVHSQQSEENPSACKQCGQYVDQTPGRKQKLFCSTACRMKWWRSHKDKMKHKEAHTRICAGCGVEFNDYGNGARKYCCRSRYIDHRFQEGSKQI